MGPVRLNPLNPFTLSTTNGDSPDAHRHPQGAEGLAARSARAVLHRLQHRRRAGVDRVHDEPHRRSAARSGTGDDSSRRAAACALSLIHISEPTRLLSISYAV